MMNPRIKNSNSNRKLSGRLTILRSNNAIFSTITSKIQ